MSAGHHTIEMSMLPSMTTFLRFKDLPYSFEFALAELVDNSTQSYLDHRTQLGPSVLVRITYDQKERMFTVYDEAAGMSDVELTRAIRLGVRPPKTDGRCEYGMGMKTSCCWMGNKWSIRTKKFGQPFEYSLQVDVQEIAKSTEGRIVATSKPAPAAKHYTVIEIWEPNRQFKRRDHDRVKRFLSEIYRFDIEEDWLKLFWGAEQLSYSAPKLYVQTMPDGSAREWKTNVDFMIDGRQVTGWVGLLAKGDYSLGGLNCYRRRRLVEHRWKPEPLFPPKPGSLVHQRVTGELFMDAFNVTHLKNGFQFDDVDLDDFGKALFKQAGEYNQRARITKFDSEEDTSAAVRFVKERLEKELADPSLIAQLNVAERSINLPPVVTAEQRSEDLSRLRAPEYPPAKLLLNYRGEHPATVWFPKTASTNDPYLDIDLTPNGERIDVIVNVRHPFAQGLNEEAREAFETYVKMLVIEALAEWLLRQEGKMNPSFQELRLVKDQLLRAQETEIRLQQPDPTEPPT